MKDRRITKTAKLSLSIWNIGLFVLVWFGFYNRFAFDRYLIHGGTVFCIVYGIIYYFFCDLYKSFRIASTPIPDIVFGQTISFGIADAILYAECCLIDNHLVKMTPGLMTVALQILGTAALELNVGISFSEYFNPSYLSRATFFSTGAAPTKIEDKTTAEIETKIFIEPNHT